MDQSGNTKESASPVKRTSLCDETEMQKILDLLPQKPPFRFIDKIIELSDEHIVGQRRYRPDEFYFQGHFPGDPITPGVILLETMAQAGLVALGIYLVGKETPHLNLRTLFSDCAIDFLEVVRPGDLVTVTGEKLFWRRNKLKTKVEMRLENGKVVAHGMVSGVGVEV